MLCKYLVGFNLLFWEVFINNKAKINTAIYYSMIGEFNTASAVLNQKWFLMYITVYVFTIWDSYTRTVQLNKRYTLGMRKDYDLVATNISGLELNILVKRQPIHAYVWSFLAPGFGHLYINRIVTSIIFIVGFVIITYFSNLLPAIQNTMIFDFEAAKKCLDVQWFLYIPSLYAFVSYDAYVNTIEYNKIYEREQAGYFKSDYQSKRFKFPI